MIDKFLDCLGRTGCYISSRWIGQHTMGRRFVKATIWKQPFRLVMVNSSIKLCIFQYSFPGYVNKSRAKKLNRLNCRNYTKDPGQLHVEVICWVLHQLRKHFLFANLKKCRFHQDEICFLGYVILSKRINMKAERIEVIKDWPEPKSVRNIQVFLGFANFYQ